MNNQPFRTPNKAQIILLIAASIVPGFVIVQHYFAVETSLPIYPDSVWPYIQASLLLLALTTPFAILLLLEEQRMHSFRRSAVALTTVAFSLLITYLYGPGGPCVLNPCWLSAHPAHATITFDEPVASTDLPLSTDQHNPYKSGTVQVIDDQNSFTTVKDLTLHTNVQISHSIIKSIDYIP